MVLPFTRRGTAKRWWGRNPPPFAGEGDREAVVGA